MNLWGRVRGAVLTSATLATCGSFEYFKAEAGLNGDGAVPARPPALSVGGARAKRGASAPLGVSA